METVLVSDPRTGLAFAPKCASNSAAGRSWQALEVEPVCPYEDAGHVSRLPLRATALRMDVRRILNNYTIRDILWVENFR